jgi:plastocyanin
MTLRTRLALGAVAALALAAPATAGAATKTVNMGTPPSDAGKFRSSGADVNAFFPSSIAIHAGDSVKFLPVGFHDVHFLGKSGKPTTPFIPTGKKIAGVNDELGLPFWFNGQAELGANPKVFGPGKLGKTVITDGTKEIYSGAPLADKPKPMTVKFTKAGLFRYVCDIHPGMKASVRVNPRSKPVPSAAADAARVKAQVAKALAVAKAFKNVKPPANTIDVGLAGRGGVSFFGFAPDKLTVPVGTTVTFRMMSGDFETHTATTGPGNPEKEPKSFLGKLASSLEGPAADQRALYPSDQPPAAAALTPASHGNGFWTSGGLDSVGASPLPMQNQVRFAAAGKYEFYCMIHPFMHATITAQ